MPKKLYRIEQGKILSGVCGGIGDYFNVDHSIIRLAMVAFTIMSVGTGIFAYLIASIIVPSKSNTF